MSVHEITAPLKYFPEVHGSGGGGKGGSSSGASEAPNTLKSTAMAKVLDMLSEGPIVGLVKAEQSIFFGGGSTNLSGITPLKNSDNTFNFNSVVWSAVTGTPGQVYIPGFEAVSTPTNVGTQVQNLGDPVAHALVRRITDANANSARITITVNALTLADTKTGSLNGNSVNIGIDIKPNATAGGAVFTEVVNDVITGKCTTPYQKSYVLELPGVAPWDIRLRRVSVDDPDSAHQSQTFWSLYSVIYNQLFNYPNSALVGLQLDSALFGTSIPTRGYDIKGLIISVPSNYNVQTRQYTGIWDGTFVQSYCNNPSWVLWDLITNTRYGMGEIIAPATVSKFDLYAAAKYNDTFVPDGVYGSGYIQGVADASKAVCAVAAPVNINTASPGAVIDGYTLLVNDRVLLLSQTTPSQNGIYVWTAAGSALTRATDMNTAGACLGALAYVVNGTQWGDHYLKNHQTVVTLGTDPIIWTGMEPLFTFNGQITGKTDAYKVLTAVAGMMRMNMVWNAGLMGFIQDAPQTPVKVFSPANVISGLFNYSGSALRARHTACIVTWNNPANAFEPEDLLVELPQAITRYGYNELGITAYGCTSVGQATRTAQYALWTEYLETDALQFSVGMGEADLKIGKLISVVDPAFTVTDYAGRLKKVNSTTSVTFDRPIPFVLGHIYTLTVITAAGVLTNVAITNPGTGSYETVTVAALNGADLPITNAMFAVTSDVLSPRSFRVIGISESTTKGEYKISAVFSDQTKFSHIEGGPIYIPAKPFSDLPSTATCVPPGAITFTYKARTQGSVADADLTINWAASTDRNLSGYVITYQEGFDNMVRLPAQQATVYHIKNPKYGVIRVLVYAVNLAGVYSLASVADIDLSTGTSGSKNLISNLTVLGGGTSWKGQTISLVWTAAPIYGAGTLATNGSDPYFANFRIKLYDSTGVTLLATFYSLTPNYTIPYDQLVTAGLARSYQIGVSTQDINGSFSNELKVTFTNPAPSLATATIIPSTYSTSLTYTPPTDADFVGIQVWLSTTNGFTPGPGNLVFQGGGGPTFATTAGTTYYLVYAYYDAFGTTGLTQSTQQTFVGAASGGSGGSFQQNNHLDPGGWTASWSDTAIAAFSNIPSVGFWNGLIGVIGQHSFSTNPFLGSTADDGNWRIVERLHSGGGGLTVIASGTFSGTYSAGTPGTDFTFTGDNCINCINASIDNKVGIPISGIANVNTGAVDVVLQAQSTTGGVTGTGGKFNVTISWTAAG